MSADASPVHLFPRPVALAVTWPLTMPRRLSARRVPRSKSPSVEASASKVCPQARPRLPSPSILTVPRAHLSVASALTRVRVMRPSAVRVTAPARRRYIPTVAGMSGCVASRSAMRLPSSASSRSVKFSPGESPRRFEASANAVRRAAPPRSRSRSADRPLRLPPASSRLNVVCSGRCASAGTKDARSGR